MSLFTIESIFIAVLCLTLAVIIFRYSQNSTHQIWALFNLVLTEWSICMFWVGIAQNEQQALLAWKLAFMGVPFIGVVYYHFVLSYIKKKRNILLILFYLYAFVFVILSLFTKQVVNKAPLLFNSIYYNQAHLISIFSAFFSVWVVIVILGFIEFFKYLKNTSGLRRIQAEFMFWSIAIGFLGGTSTVLPCYGLKFYPAFQISVMFYVLFTSYAIFKHGVIPLDLVIKRSIFYSSLVTSVTIIYFVGIVLSERFFHHIMGYKTLAGSLVSLIVIAIIFIPLKNKIQSLVDKYFLKNSPIVIAVQNENLRNEVVQTEKFKTIASMASMLAHEIKNPLTTLASLTDQLKARKDEPEFIDQYVSLVSKEVERIITLLHELLQYAKPSQPQIREINPNEIIEQIIKLVQSKCEHSKIDIICSLNTKVNIPGDFNLIKQAVLNLVLNAIDSMPNGGTLTISTGTYENPNVRGDKGRGNKRIQYTIKISDTGCGIDSKDLPLVFEPFFTKKANGTGLGLPITQGIIEKHGGRIEVTSKLTVGTDFNILLNVN